MEKKRMTWDEMVEKYPDKWVVISDPLMDGDHPDVLEGDVVAVVDDDELSDYEDKHVKENYIYRRTTESGWNGIFYADFSIKVV